MLVSVVACPENASVECKGDNGCYVRSVEGPLCGVLCVMFANVGVMKGVACGFGVNCQGVRSVLALPVLNHGMDGINKPMLRN